MAKLSGVGVVALAGGGLLLYSAIQGKSFSSSVKNVLSGSSPAGATAANPIEESTLASPASAGSAGSPGSAGSTGSNATPSSSESAWITAMLTALGAPATQANINSVSSWIGRESVYPGNGSTTGGLYNPLNTTQSASGASNYNSVGVKNYVSEAQGISATVQTLLNGRYSDIVSALRSGNGLCGKSLGGLSTWSGGGYSRVC